MNLSTLSPEVRKAFLAVVRRFAVDSGVSKVCGLEGAEQEILRVIDAGIIKVTYDQLENTIWFDVK